MRERGAADMLPPDSGRPSRPRTVRNPRQTEFSRFLSPQRFAIQDGKYLYTLPQELPIDLVLYRFDLAYPSVPNYHDHYEVNYVLHGEARLRCGADNYRCSEGDLLLLSAGVFHFLEPAEGSELEMLALYFAPEAVRAAGSTDVDLEYLVMFPGADGRRAPRIPLTEDSRARVMELYRRIARELADKRDFHRIAVKNALSEILLLAGRAIAFGRTPLGAPRVPIKDAQRLKPVFDIIRRGYTEPIAHGELARAAGMSPEGFSRYFKRVTGHTVTEYITRYRIDKAKELLLSGGREVTWIAYETGFQSHSYFDRVFRSIAKLTPQEFRTKYAPTFPADG